MATFVQIEPDAFNKVFSDTAADAGAKSNSGTGTTAASRFHHVRRPVRGIQIKDDTYATIQVRQSNGVALALFDAAAEDNSGTGLRNSNFLIQNIAEQRAEKQQVILTFGEPYIFFFGEQPRMINVSGILLNTEDFNWRAEWWENYDQFLRGTQCVRNKTRVYLSWDDIVIEGYITQSSAVDDASNNNLVQFTFQMFVTNYHNISNIGDPNALASSSINLDPATIDLPGQGGLSTTSDVRGANLQQQIQAGNSNSLFDTLRNGPATQLATTLIDVAGQKVDILSLATQFISGRNIRVPIGASGAAAFDQEVQLALSSIPGSLDVINGVAGGRTISFRPLNGIVSEFRASLNDKFGPANTGLPLSANSDEFVARIAHDVDTPRFSNLFYQQLVDDENAVLKVQAIMQKFGGVSIDLPNSLSSLVRKSQFGIVSVQTSGAVGALSLLG